MTNLTGTPQNRNNYTETHRNRRVRGLVTAAALGSILTVAVTEGYEALNFGSDQSSVTHQHPTNQEQQSDLTRQKQETANNLQVTSGQDPASIVVNGFSGGK